jgi:hypothetical protein
VVLHAALDSIFVDLAFLVDALSLERLVVSQFLHSVTRRLREVVSEV